MARPRRRRPGAGSIRKLPSGRFQASFLDPGTGLRVNAPVTYDLRDEAEEWLDKQYAHMKLGTYVSPERGATPLGEYAAQYIADRELRPGTRRNYDRLHGRWICGRAEGVPDLGRHKLKDVTPDIVRAWVTAMRKATAEGGRSQLAQAYALLRSVFVQAVEDELIQANPCRVKGAGRFGSSERQPLSAQEVAALADVIDSRLRLAVLLAVNAALRPGELFALQVKHLSLKGTTCTVKVDRGMTDVGGVVAFGPPKTEKSRRTLVLAPSVAAQLRVHVKDMTPEALLFCASNGTPVREANRHKIIRKAGVKIARPDIGWHHLRHTGLTLAAQRGATLAELMAMAGHTTPTMAARYQHATADRMARLAQELDADLRPAGRLKAV